MLERPLTLEGWGLISLLNWTAFEREDGKVDNAQSVSGYLRVYGKADLPEMDLARDSRWCIVVFTDAEAERPFALIPGCKVNGLQLFTAPCTAGWRYFVDQRAHTLADEALIDELEKRGYKTVKVPEFTP